MEEYIFEVSKVRTVHVLVQNAKSYKEAEAEVQRRMNNAIYSGERQRGIEIWDESTIDMQLADVNDECLDISQNPDAKNGNMAIEQIIDMGEKKQAETP